MVDAATGGRAILGRAIEKVVLGIPQGTFEFLNFDSVDISRLDDENPSAAITGNEGADRGTPADIKFQDKLKYSMTPSRFLFDMVVMFGKPSSVAATGGGPLDASSFVLTAAGSSGYVTGEVVDVTDAGGGTGAVVHVVASGGMVTGITVVSAGSGYVTPILAFSSGSGATGTISYTASAWLVKIRPSRLNEVRAATLYLYEGGSYTAEMQSGRRCADAQLTDGANKRVDVQVTYSDPTGDTISGFAIGKSTNDSLTGDLGLLVSTRGRRPYDANFDAGKSLFIKVTAVDANTITFVSAFGTASGATDGTGFGSPSYGVSTFTVPVSDYGTAVDELGATVGLFGENFEKFEITFGRDLSAVTVDDQYEIPIAMPVLTKTVVAESRLSAFHLVRKIGSTTEIRIDKGTTKIERPYKPYRANASRIPQAIDPTGDTKVTFTFSKRLYDRYFRKISDAHTRFDLFDSYRVESTITGTQAHESVQIWTPQCGVTGLKGGDIASKNVLEETATLMAEQPDSVPSTPSGSVGFDASALYPVQINIVTKINPTWLN